MSRIGRNPIAVPDQVKVAVAGDVVSVASADGKKKLSRTVQNVRVKLVGNQVLVERVDDSRSARACHGLYRTLIANMIDGVSKGWEKQLDVEGAGFKLELQGKTLVLTVGYSQPRKYAIPEGIAMELPSPNSLIIRGSDKELVGQTAAAIRAIRRADPYRGKGIRYKGEKAIRKVAKGKS